MKDLYVISAVVIFVMSVFTYMSFEMEALKSDVARAEAEVIKEKSRNIICNQALDTQTKEIEAQRVDYEARISAYKNMSPDVKYKVIYRDVVKDVNLTKESSCDDTKNIIDGVRTIDFSGL